MDAGRGEKYGTEWGDLDKDALAVGDKDGVGETWQDRGINRDRHRTRRPLWAWGRRKGGGLGTSRASEPWGQPL